jgi:hypothetical protein
MQRAECRPIISLPKGQRRLEMLIIGCWEKIGLKTFVEGCGTAASSDYTTKSCKAVLK